MEFPYLWHTTATRNLPSIQREGLNPLHAGRHIYLGADAPHAANYMYYIEDMWGDDEFALLQIDTSQLQHTLLGPDDVDLPDILAQEGYEGPGMSWEESLKISGQATYDGIIPPSAIEVVHIWKSGEWPL